MSASSAPLQRCDLVHDHFDLSYANYQVLPRVLMQEMPADWQQRFVDLMNEISDAFRWPLSDAAYVVQLRDRATGRFVHDPLSAYRRPDPRAIQRARDGAKW